MPNKYVKNNFWKNILSFIFSVKLIFFNNSKINFIFLIFLLFINFVVFNSGNKRIMEIKTESIHQRVPFYTGSAKMVDDVEKFIAKYDN